MVVLQFPNIYPNPDAGSTVMVETPVQQEKQIWLQQTLDGQLVRHPAPTGARLGPHEREVLRALGFGSLTSTQAGEICHRIRGHCFDQVPYGQWNSGGYHRSRYGGVNIYPSTHESYEKTRYRGQGCCPGACLEGTEVMKRLKRRGFAEKIGKGAGALWFATTLKSWNYDQEM